jgi:hypothetical protein
MKTATQEDIRAIHSRLDVHKQAIEALAIACEREGSIEWQHRDEILAMLEESQNPFNQNETGG